MICHLISHPITQKFRVFCPVLESMMDTVGKKPEQDSKWQGGAGSGGTCLAPADPQPTFWIDFLCSRAGSGGHWARLGSYKNPRGSLSYAYYWKNQSQSFNYCWVVVAITVAIMVALFRTSVLCCGKGSQIMAFLLALLILHLQIHIFSLYSYTIDPASRNQKSIVLS